MGDISQTKGVEQSPRSRKGGFFAINQRAWQGVCSLGMNPAVAYLVLACGTGPDNRTTSWSVHAVEKYTGISRGRARSAIEALEHFVHIDRHGERPHYQLRSSDEIESATKRRRTAGRTEKGDGLIWLPNALITGAATEIAPVELLRQSQDVMTLRLLIDLYYAQDLAEDAGLARHLIRQAYRRERIGQWAQYDIWAFEGEDCTVYWTGVMAAYRDSGFWDRLRTLVSLGLLEFVPTLFESDAGDAEPIHPCHRHSECEVEWRLEVTTRAAAQAMLGGGSGKKG